MRKIRFRAWDKKNKWMIPDFDNWVDFSGNYWTTPDKTYNTPNQEIVKQENIILMQFTGRKDKNGKEIFEGDVLKVDGERWNGGIREVKWISGGTFEGWNISESYQCVSEILGNIYKNPELIK